MKTLYLECTMGAAGDMLTAALLELVPDRAAALARINALGIPGVHVHADPATACGLVGTRVDVHIHGHTEEEHSHHHDHHSTGADAQQRVPPAGHDHPHHHHASRADIAAQIAALNASDAVKAHVQAVYDLVADAEAKAHGRPVSEIHFHEVGMADALSDIASVALLLEELAPARVVASRPEVGGGFVQCAHGTLPVPAPATAHILTGVPYTSGAADCELLTPTGAALLVHFADAFGPMPPLAVERTGLGLGRREVPGRLNGVRAFLGEEAGGTHCCASELGGTRCCASATGPNGRVVELRANIDDMTGEDLAFACDRLRAVGALDVSLAPLTMKKGRPGHLLIVLAPPEQADALAAAILRETSTFGVRRVDCARYELEREIVPGDVRMKVGYGYGVEKSKPEFADRTKHSALNYGILCGMATTYIGRRDFLAGVVGAAAWSGWRAAFAAAAPRRPKPSERINLGIIGCGTQAYANVPAFLRDERVQVTVVCDPVLEAGGYSYDGKHPGGRKVFKEKVDAHYGNASCRMTADWREVVADPTVDAVVVITPDHWHAIIAIAVMKAGKHVYCQKPMSLGVREGQEMVRVAKASGVTFQVGSQHRQDSSFRQAGELVASGYIGAVKYAEVGLPGANGGQWGHGRDTSHQAHPGYFTQEGWDMWLGPSQHWENDAFIPAIHEPMCWRWNSRTGGGMITDWGAHWIDILQWTIGAERTGPVAVENMTTNLSDDPCLNWADKYAFDLVYADGFRAHVSDAARCGITWHGEKGDIFVDWTKIERPDFLKKWREKTDLKLGDKHFYRAANGHSHESDFIDGIYENRPIATDCEIGHRSISACHIANICERLRLAKLTWDPQAESFTGAHAEEANRLLETPHLNGWTL